MRGKKCLYFDIGVLLNLLVTARAKEIIRSLPYTCAIIEEIKNTPIFLWKSASSQETPIERYSVSLEAYIYEHIIDVHRYDERRNLACYLQFASNVPTKQAALLTLVVTNRAVLVSDDVRTRTVLHTISPDTPLLSTLDILHLWQEYVVLSDDEMRAVSRTLQDQAQFIPLNDDPLLPWWKRILDQKDSWTNYPP